ncbi:MAG: WD40 repeat domain-containing protein [Planctomycetota bacterium]|nr:WD40 repeat domain-containing protein [Planctomycetota bacterium]
MPGNTLASTDLKSIHIWDVDSQVHTTSIVAHHSWVYCVATSPDGKKLATVGNDSRLKLWNVNSGACEFTSNRLPQFSESVQYSPDGRWLAFATGSMIRLRSTDSRQELHVLRRHRARIKSVKISPDGSLLASGSYDNTIKIWGMEDSEELKHLKGHSERVWCVDFAPDGNVLASASWDKTIQLWDIEAGNSLATLTGHDDLVNCVAFAPDGKCLASGDRGGTVKLWDVTSFGI